MNKVISETDSTGRKLKTFVPANGTTLATQALYYHTQPATESLTFNHTDASGTGVQQTTASVVLIGNTTTSRTGEYSPMGRNLASIGPYITLNTYQEPGEGGMNMFGSGEGYRPGQNTYTIDGLSVSASQFMLEINSGRIGGMFGLMEMAARMSAQPPRLRNLQVGNRFFDPTIRGANLAIDEALEEGLPIIRNIVINDLWSALSALLTIQTRNQKETQKSKKDTEINNKNLLDSINKCIDSISRSKF